MASSKSAPAKSARAMLVAIVAALVTFAPSAHATDPDRVEWSKDWPRVRLAEVVDVVGLTAASYAISAYWTPPHQANWNGPILFDNWVRDALRGRSYATQQFASDLSDDLYKGATIAPYVIDVYFVALGVHQNADVALQMFLINLQSLGLSGVGTLAAEHAVGRSRPYVRDCDSQGDVRDAHGNLLFNHCDGVGDFQSFYSGHIAAVGTMAGLTCVHHQHLPLYGGGFADLAPCLLMIGAALTTGVARIVADRHWATDVVTGGLVAFGSGYLMPSALHYGFNGGKPLGEVKTKTVSFVPVPQVYTGGAGMAITGMF
jgi:membrane-associated phospholipid phosphatase